MNRYDRGSSTIVASRLGSAHVGAQLKVENPVSLRTIWNFDLLPSLRASYRCNAMLIYAEALIKNQLKIKTRRYSAGDDTNIARKKSRQGSGPVRLKKRQQKQRM